MSTEGRRPLPSTSIRSYPGLRESILCLRNFLFRLSIVLMAFPFFYTTFPIRTEKAVSNTYVLSSFFCPRKHDNRETANLHGPTRNATAHHQPARDNAIKTVDGILRQVTRWQAAKVKAKHRTRITPASPMRRRLFFCSASYAHCRNNPVFAMATREAARTESIVGIKYYE